MKSTQVRKEAKANASAKQGRKLTKPIKEFWRANPGKVRLVAVPKEINHEALAAALALPAAVQSKTPSDALPVCDPNKIAKGWILLRLGKNDCDDNLWASREGLLYLWHSDQGYHLPRVVSTAAAQRWIAEHGQDRWCEPYFPEDSPAHELVNVPRIQNYAAPTAAASESPATPGQEEAAALGQAEAAALGLMGLEVWIQRTTALLSLCAWQLHRRKGDDLIGVIGWADDCAESLREHWKAASHGLPRVKDFGVASDELVQCQRAVVGVEQSVARADVLLQMLTQELAFEEKENLDNETSAPAYSWLADDCLDGLKKRWRETLSAWDALMSPLDERLKLKAA